MTLAVERMGRRVTVPFERGADAQPIGLAPGADDAHAIVDAYDFTEHHARFDAVPDPRYVLALTMDVAAPVTVQATHAAPAGTTTPLTFPAGARGSQSAVLDLGSAPPTGLRLTGLVVDGVPAGATADTLFTLTALLGNTAKLLWALGWERDNVNRELGRVAAQRRRGAGVGRGLDLVGYDLGVPRFVPLPYSYDDDTTLLLHLDDRPPSGQPEVTTVSDARALHVASGAAHDGTNSGAASGAPGRFGRGFRFADPAASISVAEHADFAMGVTASTTVECFVKPAPDTTTGELISKHPDPRVATPGPAGWALTIGEFGRGLPRNLRLLLSDGALRHELFADDPLRSDVFQHIAGVVDRAAGQARLYVDGRLRAVVALGALGALTNAQPVRLGMAGGPAFAGTLDEVRISRVARAGFAPVLGESDDSYRRRLAIFQRWTLPTPHSIQSVLNEVVGTIGGLSDPLLVDDVPSTLVQAGATVALVPKNLPQGAHIDGLGRRRSTEPDVSGSAADEADEFRVLFLVRHADARAVYQQAPARELRPGEPAPDAHAMQAVTGRALTALLNRLGAEGVVGTFTVVSAFDPRAADLRAVGRALLLRHSALSVARLAAHAHAAGFAWVENRHPDGAVYASVPRDEYLELAVGTAGAIGDVAVGDTLAITATPALGKAARWTWVLVPCASGRAHFAVLPTGPSAQLVADGPGTITVRGEARGAAWRASGTREVRIAPKTLADGQVIASSGALSVGPSAPPDEELDPFHPVHLLTSDQAIAYGDDDARRMQAAAAQALERLVALVGAEAPATALTVTECWVRGATDLRGRGRELTVTHSTLDPGRLGALAWGAGFAQVWRVGSAIHARSAQSDALIVAAPPEIEEGANGPIAVRPRAQPNGVAATTAVVVTANAGSDSISVLDPATGRVARAVKVGRLPDAVALTSTGTTAFSADRLSGRVTAVDVATGAVSGTVSVPAGPAALLLRGTRLYVVCRDAARLVVVDTSTLTVTENVACRSEINGFAADAAGASVWLTAFGDQAVQVFTTGPLTLATELTVTSPPAGVGILDANDRAYVTLQDEGQVQAFTVSTRTPVAAFAAGSNPVFLAVSAAAGRVLVLDLEPQRELVRSFTPTGQPRGTARVPSESTALATADGRLYVTGHGRDHVCAIDVSPAQLELAGVWRLGAGIGESFTWETRPAGSAAARVAAPTSPESRMYADEAGRLSLRAVYSLGDHQDPYAFEVRLLPVLDVRATVIRKDQYDLLMNVLNLLHPIGIEVRTRSIREHVLEVRAGQLDAFPAYTYPDFRVRGPVLARPRRDS